MENSKRLLKKMAEETIYSAKGHFKSADVRSGLIGFVIWSCMILAILRLASDSAHIGKISASLTLFGSIALLLWNQGESKDYRQRHKEIGEKYLSLHKELRELFYLEKLESSVVENISLRIRNLDQSLKPTISYLGRNLSKRAIEKNKETDNWYK